MTLVGIDGADARARCAAGLYYRPSQGRCVSAQEFKRVLGRLPHHESPHQASRPHVRTVAKPEETGKAIERQPTEEPETRSPAAAMSAPPPDSLLLEMLPPNVQLWEKQYPTQWN
jgi:hypothetical protein